VTNWSLETENERGKKVEQSNELFKVSTLQEAMNKLRPYMLPFYDRQEEVSLEKSWGRIVAEDLTARSNLPLFRKSTVDGLAVKAADTFGASESLPALINKIGEVEMGVKPSLSVGKGEGVIIPTGGMVPEGADAIVMVENLEHFGDSLYGVAEPVAPGDNLIEVGEDITRGEIIAKRYSLIRPQEMGLLAAQGFTKIPVVSKFRLGFLSTGDEIVSPDIEPGPGQTRDINSYTLMGQAIACGSEVKHYGIVGDNEEKLKATLKTMLEENDIIILSGGSSVGKRDLTSKVIEDAGESRLLFHGLALRPGKPTLAGVAQGKIILGLPGHPTSAMIVFDNLVRPWLDASALRRERFPKPEGILTQNVYSGSGREEFVQVRITSEDGKWYLEPVRGKSGLISTMVQADGLVHITLEQEGLEANRKLEVRLLR
jgi:molybdopterin molybdotransferase